MFSIPCVYFMLIQSGRIVVSYQLIGDNINYDLSLMSEYKKVRMVEKFLFTAGLEQTTVGLKQPSIDEEV